MTPPHDIHQGSNGQAGQQGQQQGLAIAGLQYHGILFDACDGVVLPRHRDDGGPCIGGADHEHRFQSAIAGKLHRVITQVRAAIHRIRG